MRTLENWLEMMKLTKSTHIPNDAYSKCEAGEWPCFYCTKPIPDAGKPGRRVIFLHPECEAMLRLKDGQ